MRPESSFYDREPKRPKAGKLGKAPPTNPQEERIGKMLRGARAQPGSGNKPGRKGDHEGRKVESCLIEEKHTKDQALSVQASWLSQVTRQARDARKTPVLVVGFERMPVPTERDWAMIPMSKFRLLAEAAGWELE